jgi:hypothetical protein
LTLVVAVAATLLASSQAQAASRQHVVTVKGTVHAVFDAVPDQSLCAAQGGEYVVRPTDYFYSATSTYKGTFTGTGRHCGHSTSVNPDGSASYVETTTFTGRVAGCGRGSVIFNVHGVLRPAFDASRRAVPIDDDWKIVARSGTAGLRGLTSGSGHDTGWLNVDSSLDADVTGHVTCTPFSR